MIPTHIIEKAIATGWKSDLIRKWNNLETEREFDEFIEWYWPQIALDPDFWMALGKEMGWSRCCNFDGDRTTLCDRFNEGRNGDWIDEYKYHAKNFYDLILRKASQEEIDAHWQQFATQPDSTQPLNAKGETS